MVIVDSYRTSFAAAKMETAASHFILSRNVGVYVNSINSLVRWVRLFIRLDVH